MGDLSPHFSSSEFADPKTGECKMNPMLISGLEEMRSLTGKPIKISSGYRSPEHNKEVGGVSHSQHVLGNAADISIGNLDTLHLFILAEQIEVFRNGGIGIYPGQNFIHVDVRGSRARWSRVSGTYMAIQDGVI